MNNKALKEKIENVLNFHDKYRNSYFWGSYSTANQRRNEEQRFNEKNPELRFNFKGSYYEVVPTLYLSCKNVYYRLKVYKDGVKKTALILKKIINDISSKEKNKNV